MSHLPPDPVRGAAPVAQAKFSEVVFRDHTVIARSVQLHPTAVHEVIAHEQQLASHWPDLNRRVASRIRIEWPVEGDGTVAFPAHSSDTAPLSLARPRKDYDGMTSRLRCCRTIQPGVATDVLPTDIAGQSKLCRISCKVCSRQNFPKVASIISTVQGETLAPTDLGFRVRALVLSSVRVEKASSAGKRTLVAFMHAQTESFDLIGGRKVK